MGGPKNPVKGGSLVDLLLNCTVDFLSIHFNFLHAPPPPPPTMLRALNVNSIDPSEYFKRLNMYLLVSNKLGTSWLQRWHLVFEENKIIDRLYIVCLRFLFPSLFWRIFNENKHACQWIIEIVVRKKLQDFFIDKSSNFTRRN